MWRPQPSTYNELHNSNTPFATREPQYIKKRCTLAWKMRIAEMSNTQTKAKTRAGALLAWEPRTIPYPGSSELDRTGFMFEVIATFDNAPQQFVRFHMSDIMPRLTNQRMFHIFLWTFFARKQKSLCRLSFCIHNITTFYPNGASPLWLAAPGGSQITRSHLFAPPPPPLRRRVDQSK